MTATPIDPPPNLVLNVALSDADVRALDAHIRAAAQVAVLADRASRAVEEPAGWRSALKFYAEQAHFAICDDSAWDTVSGEPANFWCDEAGTATVEDGTVAAMALAGTPLPDEDDAQGGVTFCAGNQPVVKYEGQGALQWEDVAAPAFPPAQP